MLIVSFFALFFIFVFYRLSCLSPSTRSQIFHATTSKCWWKCTNWPRSSSSTSMTCGGAARTASQRSGVASENSTASSTWSAKSANWWVQHLFVLYFLFCFNLFCCIFNWEPSYDLSEPAFTYSHLLAEEWNCVHSAALKPPPCFIYEASFMLTVQTADQPY